MHHDAQIPSIYTFRLFRIRAHNKILRPPHFMQPHADVHTVLFILFAARWYTHRTIVGDYRIRLFTCTFRVRTTSRQHNLVHWWNNIHNNALI